MQELLVLIVIGLAIFYLPRMMGRRSTPSPGPAHRPPSLTGRMRLAILITFLWVAAWALLLKPWEENLLPFVSFALGPAAALWGAAWGWVGYRRHRR